MIYYIIIFLLAQLLFFAKKPPQKRTKSKKYICTKRRISKKFRDKAYFLSLIDKGDDSDDVFTI